MEVLLKFAPLLSLFVAVSTGFIVVMRVNDFLTRIEKTVLGLEDRVRATEKDIAILHTEWQIRHHGRPLPN